MKCPKCGYHSFEYLDTCKKCGTGLNEHKAKYNIRGLTMPGTAATPEKASKSAAAEAEQIATVDSADNESIDFGFDFLEEDEEQAGEHPGRIALDDDQDIRLDQAFGFDDEIVAAETPAEKKDKSEKGSEFAF